MKSNKVLTIGMAIFLSVLYLPGMQACERNSVYEFEHAITILKNVNSNKLDTESYHFSTGNCVKLTNQTSGVEISSYIPEGENSLGLHKLLKEQKESSVN